MADVDLTVESPDADGLAATYVSIDATDVYFVKKSSGEIILHFKNVNAGAATVTFDITQTREGESFTDPTVNVPATTGEIFVRMRDIWRGIGVRSLDVKFSQDLATGMTVAVLRG